MLTRRRTNPLIPAWPELIIGTIALPHRVRRARQVPAAAGPPRRWRSGPTQIEGGLARSDEAQAEAKQLLDQYREQLAEARHEAARLREEAREQGAQIIAEMREQAQAEARRITESAQAQIEAERQQALTALRDRGRRTWRPSWPAGSWASRSTDEARQSRMVDRFLDELEVAGQ